MEVFARHLALSAAGDFRRHADIRTTMNIYSDVVTNQESEGSVFSIVEPCQHSVKAVYMPQRPHLPTSESGAFATCPDLSRG